MLTAAHCVYNRSYVDYSALAGTIYINNDDPAAIPVEKFVHHQEYKPYKGYDNDIAILRVCKLLYYYKMKLL